MTIRTTIRIACRGPVFFQRLDGLSETLSRLVARACKAFAKIAHEEIFVERYADTTAGFSLVEFRDGLQNAQNIRIEIRVPVKAAGIRATSYAEATQLRIDLRKMVSGTRALRARKGASIKPFFKKSHDPHLAMD